ncbi:hypothetical protein C2G38_2087107, partial [Gigaspora rosea]
IKKIDDSNYINNMLMPGQENMENKSWGCGYHGDDGYSFYSGSGTSYDLKYYGNIPGYTTGDIVGCYLNFRENIVFYTKNGINLAMTNEDINKKSKNALILEYQEKVDFIISEYEYMLVSLINDLTISLENEPNNAFELNYRGKLYFIMGKYDEAFEDLTRLLEIEPDNTIALRYRGEINYIMKKYTELLRINPNDVWAKKVYELVNML